MCAHSPYPVSIRHPASATLAHYTLHLHFTHFPSVKISHTRACVNTRRHLQTTKTAIKWSPLDVDFISCDYQESFIVIWSGIDRNMSRRQGMILVESASGEYDTLAKLQELAATDSESEGEGAVDYGLVESSSPSSGDDGSYHSDNDELAEYWDPYCKSRGRQAAPHANKMQNYNCNTNPKSRRFRSMLSE